MCREGVPYCGRDGRSAVGERGHAGRRDRSPKLTPIRANQIRDVLMRNWPAMNTATPGMFTTNAPAAKEVAGHAGGRGDAAHDFGDFEPPVGYCHIEVERSRVAA